MSARARVAVVALAMVVLVAALLLSLAWTSSGTTQYSGRQTPPGSGVSLTLQGTWTGVSDKYKRAQLAPVIPEATPWAAQYHSEKAVVMVVRLPSYPGPLKAKDFRGGVATTVSGQPVVVVRSTENSRFGIVYSDYLWWERGREVILVSARATTQAGKRRADAVFKTVELHPLNGSE